MSRWMPTARSSRIMRPHPQMCMTAMNSPTSLPKKTRLYMRTVPMSAKKSPDHVENRVCEKGYRGKPLTDEQKESNRKKSKTRCRIEHVFGFMTGSTHGITLRSIGIERAEFNIGLTNLAYNICRYTILKPKRCVWDSYANLKKISQFSGLIPPDMTGKQYFRFSVSELAVQKTQKPIKYNG